MKRVSFSQRKTIHTSANAALFDLRDRLDFLNASLLKIFKLSKALVISDDAAFLPTVPKNQRIDFAAVGLNRVLIEPNDVLAKLKLEASGQTSGIVVDMRWAISNSEAVSSLEQWGDVAERLSSEMCKPIISVYNQDVMIEVHMQTALRVHSRFLAPSGLYENPYWIPAKLLATATLDEQLAFMLGRVVLDYEGLQMRYKGAEMAARSATPSWLPVTDAALGASAASKRWQIHCFGELRVFIGGKNVNWRIAGSTPKKTQTLFAYLLQCGPKGANTERISELLWPDEERDATKRARLHHTIAMLRKTLGLPQSIIREGDYYRLNAPTGSWIDISTFEQQCRRGLALFKKADYDSTLSVYLAADQLYMGDLFENLPREYVESEIENWCLPRRMWLKEMALKLQNNLTTVLMRMARTREALHHCLKALAIDPANESANQVAMQIFAAQGRDDAVHRQYKQYQQALKTMGESESAELRAHYRTLITKEKPKNAD